MLSENLSEYNKELMEKMQAAIDERESALIFNMRDFVRRMVFRLCLLNDSNATYNHGKNVWMAADLDAIVDTIIKTSHYSGGCEPYPVWDKKSVAEQMERVMEVLRKANVALE